MQQDWEQLLLPRTLLFQHQPFSRDSGKYQNFPLIFEISNFFFFSSDPWFEFRNASGACPVTAKEIQLVHNYALKYLAEKKSKSAFWASAPPLSAIKPKYKAYLEGIDHRIKILEETPRTETERDTIMFTLKGFFSDYDVSKTFQSQKPTDQHIALALDAQHCRLYGDRSREFAQKFDESNKANIEALISLAIMELQFMHGCDVPWSGPGDGGSAAAASSSQALTSGSLEDDADGGNDQGGGNGRDDDGDDPEFEFTTLDLDNIVEDVDLEGVDYSDAAEFMSNRESFAMSILFFLCEGLGVRHPEVMGQVHAGWLHTFKKPITIDQLYDRPKEITFEFTEEEENWFTSTIQFFVGEMSPDRLEALGITAQHLAALGVVPPAPSTVAAGGKVVGGKAGGKAPVGTKKVPPIHGDSMPFPQQQLELLLT